MLGYPPDPLATLDHVRLKAFLDCVGSFAFAIDVLPDGSFRFAAANSRFEHAIGDKGLIVGRTPVELFPGPAGTAMEAHCQRCVDTRRTISWHVELRSAKMHVWWSIDLSARADRTGHVVRLIGTATDITDLKMQFIAGQRSDLRLEGTLEQIDEAVALWDASGRLVVCNEPYRDFYTIAGGALRPGVYRADVARHDILLSQSLPGDRGFDQSPTASERWLNDGRCVVASERALPHGDSLEVRMDITYRKRTERAVSQSRTILHTMLNSVDEMIALFNCDGVLLAMNRRGAEWLDGKPDRLVGNTLDTLFDVPVARSVRTMLDTVLDSGDPLRTELTWRTRILDVSLNPVAGEDGTSAAVSLVARDITERCKAEERAREHQQIMARCLRIATIGEMAAAVVHELSQPITAASTFCHASLRNLHHGRAVPADLADSIGEVCREVDRAGAILTNIARFVRKSTTERSEVTINTLVSAATDLARRDLERGGVTLVLDLADDLPPVLVSAVEIEQVVLNLVRNSLDAMVATAQPVVRVRTLLRGGDTVEVEVVDNGSGFAEEDLESFFKPFFSTKPGGIGMGLAICRTIVEAHGGQISAASAPSGGAVVRFTLPLKDTRRVR